MTTNKQLRELAEKAKSGAWYDSGNLRYYDGRTGEAYELPHSEGQYLAAASPETILALLENYEAPQPAEQRPFDYADAYQGAREDLAIWKRRALEAERRVRKQGQIIDRMSDALTAHRKGGDV